MLLRLSLYGLVLCSLVVPVHASQDLIKVSKIRQKCEKFDQQSKGATRQSRVVLEMSHEGSDITALETKGETRKLFVTHLGTMGSQQETIYLENGQPVWVTKIQTTYDAPMSGRAVERIEEWLYFENGKLIQRDFMPVSIVKGINRLDKPWFHQTSIQSPAQARDWKAKTVEWQQKVAQYQRALKAKP